MATNLDPIQPPNYNLLGTQKCPHPQNVNFFFKSHQMVELEGAGPISSAPAYGGNIETFQYRTISTSPQGSYRIFRSQNFQNRQF